jgi:hypothetical protein
MSGAGQHKGIRAGRFAGERGENAQRDGDVGGN